MTHEEFWNLIESSRPDNNNDTEHVDRLQRLLEGLPSEEIISFQRIRGELMHDSYRAGLWNVVYIVDGGCSDDAFDYFRFWLMLQGERLFYEVLNNPRSLADPKFKESSLRNEEFGSVALRAYETVTGSWDMPYDGPSGPGTLEGELLDEEGMKKQYPDLWKRFVDDN